MSSIPVVSQITGQIQVSTVNHHPDIRLVSIAYQKVSLLAASSELNDRIQIVAFTGTASGSVRYYLSAVVQYENQVVIQGGSDLGDGAYLIKGAFWPRSEQHGIPYLVTITVSQDGYYYASIEATIMPT
jgi:hypothetical protein